MTRAQRAVLSTAALLGMLVWPAPVSADDKATTAYWMAAASNTATVQWGRLVLKDGALAFYTTHGDWKAPLHTIARVSRVNRGRTLEIVTASGSTLHLSILGPNMVPASPLKALQTIQRAIREAAPPAPVVTLTASIAPR